MSHIKTWDVIEDADGNRQTVDHGSPVPAGWVVIGETALQSLPAPAVPQAVTMRQGRLALLGAGLLTQVNDAIAAMTGVEGDAARIEWEFAATIDRDSDWVSNLSSALGLTDAQLDGLFVQAAAL